VANPSIERRFRTNDRQLRHRRLNTNLYRYTMFSNNPSTRGNAGGQIYTNDMDWTRFYPMKSKSQAHETLSVLMSRDGVPATLISDGAKEQVKGQFRSKARQAGIDCKETEPHSQWQNRAESVIREMEKAVARAMIKEGSPKVLWDYYSELVSLIHSHTAHNIFLLNGQVPETHMCGGTADISEICDSGWYQWVMYCDTSPAIQSQMKESCLDVTLDQRVTSDQS